MIASFRQASLTVATGVRHVEAEVDVDALRCRARSASLCVDVPCGLCKNILPVEKEKQTRLAQF